jgi:hypothetical protein
MLSIEGEAAGIELTDTHLNRSGVRVLENRILWGKWKLCLTRPPISLVLAARVSIRFENQSMSRDFRSAMAYSGYEPVER